MSRTLHINVANKVATYNSRDGEIVGWNSDYSVVFTFDSEWEGVANKVARFIWNGQYTDVNITNNECKMPIISNTSLCTVGVYSGDLITSTPAKIPCRLSVLCGFPVERVENIWLRKLIEGTLTEITPELLTGVTEIRGCAFQDYFHLTSIVIPEGVKRIYYQAFFNCGNVKKFRVPDSLDYFDASAIYGDSTGIPSEGSRYTDEYGSDYLGNDKNNYVVLLWLNYDTELPPIKDGVKVLANMSCDVGSEIISLPDSLQGIMDYAVTAGNESIHLGKNLTYIDEYAFSNCPNLKEIVIDAENEVYTSEGGIVYDKQKTTIRLVPKKIASVVIPDTVKAIKASQFRLFKSLTSAVIGAGVTSIGRDAFNGCTSLTSVEYRGQALLSPYIFYNCGKITKYDFRHATDIPTLASRTYIGHAAGCKIIVPDELYDEWKAKTTWSAITDVVWVKASEYTEE